MTRSIAIIGLILAFVVAQQNNSEYWVINRAMCLETMATSCSEYPLDCVTTCGSDTPCTDSDSDCGKSCTDSTDCSVSDTRPVCFQFTCEKQSQNLPCCILVHPFWGETQTRLNLTPDHSVANLTSTDRFTQLPEDPQQFIATNPDPPWGVHPLIAITVLRI